MTQGDVYVLPDGVDGLACAFCDRSIRAGAPYCVARVGECPGLGRRLGDKYDVSPFDDDREAAVCLACACQVGRPDDTRRRHPSVDVAPRDIAARVLAVAFVVALLPVILVMTTVIVMLHAARVITKAVARG